MPKRTIVPCRLGCGACCIAVSISSPLPGMPEGKPAGVPCVNLDPETFACRIWGTPDYPEVCRDFQPTAEMCLGTREHALAYLNRLEAATRPGSDAPE